MKKITIIFSTILLLITLGVSPIVSFADDTPTPSPSPTGGVSGTPTPDQSQVSQLQSQINDLENKIAGTQAQEKTLSSTIAVMDSQISLTQLKINSTQNQIAELTANIKTASTKIATLQGSLTNITKILLQRIVATYKAGDVETTQTVLASNNLNDLVERASYLKIVQKHDKQLMYDTQQAQNDYANQKQIFQTEKQQVEALQTQLQQYSTQLDQQKQQKQALLTETQGNEATYQRILAQTEAQLASFRGFVSSQGGASLLSGQTVCDDWGCYYNQRDSQWGASALNGTGYSIADSGCLLTSMAMVYTHYGHKDVTPVSINSNSGNFDGIPAALLRFSITANGVSSTRTRIGSSSGALPDTITDPIIVGISYDGGPYPDHFIVLISGSLGSYMMNDPYTPNGHNIPFTSHYSLGSIVEVDKVSM